ncbi:transposase [Streptomyces sp. NPDC032472]|uniref:RNA-guided endonuclease InsQ/TnpB family protein n=1 Tax=Streptomyces sp. NPDC032472 TaxID=3155018 RepID=UPI0033FF1AA3
MTLHSAESPSLYTPQSPDREELSGLRNLSPSSSLSVLKCTSDYRSVGLGRGRDGSCSSRNPHRGRRGPYPNESQAEQLRRTFGACRWVSNEGLALRVSAWQEHHVSVGFAETSRALTGWRRASETSWLQDVSSTVLQQALRHLDTAFTRFFRGMANYPKPKRKHRSRDSATYVRTGFRWHEDPERPGTGLHSPGQADRAPRHTVVAPAPRRGAPGEAHGDP